MDAYELGKYLASKPKAIKQESDIRDVSDVRRWDSGEGPYSMTMALRCIEVLLYQLHGVTYGEPCPYRATCKAIGKDAVAVATGEIADGLGAAGPSESVSRAVNGSGAR